MLLYEIPVQLGNYRPQKVLRSSDLNEISWSVVNVDVACLFFISTHALAGSLIRCF